MWLLVFANHGHRRVLKRGMSEFCRWGLQASDLQEVDMTIAGLAVTVLSAEVPLAARLLLAPQTWDLHYEQSASAASTAVLLHAGALTACVSPAAANALAGLQAALMPGPSPGQPEAEVVSNPTPAAAAAQQTDDLSCGLFSLSPELAGHPGSPSVCVPVCCAPRHQPCAFG